MKSFASLQVAAAIVTSLVAGETAMADVIRQQQACDGVCVSIPGGTNNGVFTARSFTFNAPRKGTAIVSFNGTLYCGNNAMSFIDLYVQSQIVENNAVPSPTGPSGLDYATTLESANGGSRVTTFNLASSRVFQIPAAGTRTFQFRVKAIILSASAGCSVRQGAFRVHLVE